MPAAGNRSEDIGDRARALYDRELREKLEPQYNGRLLVVDVESGDFELADSLATLAVDRLKARRPNAEVFLLRVGRRTAFRIGVRKRSA